MGSFRVPNKAVVLRLMNSGRTFVDQVTAHCKYMHLSLGEGHQGSNAHQLQTFSQKENCVNQGLEDCPRDYSKLWVVSKMTWHLRSTVIKSGHQNPSLSLSGPLLEVGWHADALGNLYIPAGG